MVELLLGEDHELLVGGGSDGEWYVVRNEYFLETFSHADGVMAHTEIEIIGERMSNCKPSILPLANKAP